MQNEQISETPVPFVQLLGVAPGAWSDPTELLSLPSKKFAGEYADLLRGASVFPKHRFEATRAASKAGSSG